MSVFTANKNCADLVTANSSCTNKIAEQQTPVASENNSDNSLPADFYLSAPHLAFW